MTGSLFRRALTSLFAAVLMLGGLIGVVVQDTAPVAAAPGGIVYDSIPSPTAGNYPSLGLEAYQGKEFGDKVTLAGGSSALGSAKILLSSWACQTGSGNTCATTPGATFPVQMTFKAYATSGAIGVGSALLTKTQTFNVPYRPSADPACGAGGQWSSPDCFNGFATPITFDLTTGTIPASPVVLPATVIWTVQYNTFSQGYTPTGIHTGADSLNVALTPAATVGTDVDADGIYWNTSTAGWYCDGGLAGTSTLRNDSGSDVGATPGCWAGYVPAAEFTQLALPTVSIGNVNIKEGNAGTSAANVPITLSHAYPAPVVVHYKTAPGLSALAKFRATQTSDFVAAEGNLTIPANTTSAVIPIAIKGDTTLEQHEQFLVNLSNPVNATLTMAQSSVVTILNDELPTVKLTVGTSKEGLNTPFQVSLAQQYWTALTLTANTIGNTAASPGDYVALINQSVVFPANATGPLTVNVHVNTDGLTEPIESFSLQVSGGAATIAKTSKIGANKT
jgi:hypothetical protein